MPKRKPARKTRASRSPLPILFVLVLIAVAAGWFLLRPSERKHHPHKTVVSAVTPPPSETPLETPSELPTAAVATESPTPSAQPSPTASTSARASLAPLPPRAGNPNAPKLAIIVDDCGQWLSTERGFIALPVPVTLSVLPDVHGTATIAQEAHDAGKGVMLHLPMDTLSGMNPGPGKVTTAMTDAQITAQLENDLAQVPLAQGVNNHEGSKGSADTRVMTDVIDVLAKRNLFFIDSRTNAASVGEQIAAANGVKTAARDVFLDNKADVAYSEQQLREAAAIAKRTGSAIAIGHPKPTTLAAVKALVPELQAEGIEFVLVRDLAR
ncbi:MAG TPA: divergent polysaccharide deacetylase family protein [Candidatus Aquilonibacter sp.]|nr:divergent polysaccharide deacetylase family protein [Candidatus Aquilonibacter sp.]